MERNELQNREETETGLMAFLQRRPGLSAALLLLFLAILFMGKVLLPPQGQVLGGHDMRGYYYPYYDQVREAVRDDTAHHYALVTREAGGDLVYSAFRLEVEGGGAIELDRFRIRQRPN